MREPAQSKRMCRFHKSHFAQKFTRKIPRPRLSPECRHSLRNRNALQHFTRDIRRATFYRNLKMPLPRFSTSHKRHQKSHFIQKFRGKMPGPRSRGRGHTFMRACAVEMHFNISQETSEEPLYRKFTRKRPRPRLSPERADTHFVRACAVEMRVHMSQETSEEPSHFIGNLQEKCRGPD